MRKSFEIALVLDDEERTFSITPSFRAISEIESHEVHRGGDGSLMAILSRFGIRRQKLSDFVAIVHGSLRAQGEIRVSADEIGEAIVEAGQTNFIVPCVHFLNEALGVSQFVTRSAPKKKKPQAKSKKKARGKKKKSN